MVLERWGGKESGLHPGAGKPGQDLKKLKKFCPAAGGGGGGGGGVGVCFVLGVNE